MTLIDILPHTSIPWNKDLHLQFSHMWASLPGKLSSNKYRKVRPQVSVINNSTQELLINEHNSKLFGRFIQH